MHTKNANGPLARAGCTKGLVEHPNRSNSAEQSQPIPASIASEKAILGAIMEDDDLIMPVVIASGLRAEDFLLSDHARIFRAIVALWLEKKHIDLILVAERLGNRIEDAVAATACIQGVIVHPDHIAFHIEIVRDEAQRRALLHFSEWLPKVIDDPAPADALIEQAIQKLEAISTAEVRG